MQKWKQNHTNIYLGYIKFF